jgi:hypothetical protein
MNMAAELKRQGIATEDAFKYLRAARAILNEYTADKKAEEKHLIKASELIDTAQKDIFIAAKPLGKKFTTMWENKFKEILRGKRVGEFRVVRSSTFYPSLPRNKNWIRIAATKAIREKLENVEGIEVRDHGEGYVLVMGDRLSLRKALDEISDLMKGKK